MLSSISASAAILSSSQAPPYNNNSNNTCPMSKASRTYLPFSNLFMFRRRSFFSAMTKKTFSSSAAADSSSTASIQILYDLCKETFARPDSSSSPPLLRSQAIQNLSSLLDTIGPSDVGLEAESQEDDRGHGTFGLNLFNRVDRWAQPITYVDVHESDNFTMCIFCFPTSSVIPLHDHPGMTVLSKVLYGSMHVKAYDWVEPSCIVKRKGINNPPVRLAQMTVDKVLTAQSGTSVLYPKSGGNLHCFTAITPCAVLDVLAPPYNEPAGRKCTYYHDHPYSTFSAGDGCETVGCKDDDYAWLEEVETPDDLYMRPGRYTGPIIQI